MAGPPGPAQLIRVLRAQADALVALPADLLALNRSVRLLTRSLDPLLATLGRLQGLADRLDQLLTEAEASVQELRPGLHRLAVVLDDPVLSEVPEALRAALPALHRLPATQQQVASISSATQRVATLVDDVETRLGGLPGLGRWARRGEQRPGEPPG